MTHPLVDQFRFTRSESLRGLLGMPKEDGAEGHKDLPEFVGDIEIEAPYRPE